MHIDHDALVLQNEADVELKIIAPLLQGPAYLDIPERAIKPKQYLASTPFSREAGQTSGSYPDYTVWFHSFPCRYVRGTMTISPADIMMEAARHGR